MIPEETNVLLFLVFPNDQNKLITQNIIGHKKKTLHTHANKTNQTCIIHYSLPVVPHKAVAEVSRIGNV